MAYDPDFMKRAIELSEQALSVPGAGPYGAVVVKDGRVVGEGFNQVVCNHDPTSHGEIEAIRAACTALQTVDLSGCDLYTSCEPCALCVATMTITNVDQLYYAAGMADAAALMPDPPDSPAVMREAGTPVGEGRLPAEQRMDQAALAVLGRWARAEGRSHG